MDCHQVAGLAPVERAAGRQAGSASHLHRGPCRRRRQRLVGRQQRPEDAGRHLPARPQPRPHRSGHKESATAMPRAPAPRRRELKKSAEASAPFCREGVSGYEPLNVDVVLAALFALSLSLQPLRSLPAPLTPSGRLQASCARPLRSRASHAPSPPECLARGGDGLGWRAPSRARPSHSSRKAWWLS